MINTNLPPILHRFQVMADYMSNVKSLSQIMIIVKAAQMLILCCRCYHCVTLAGFTELLFIIPVLLTAVVLQYWPSRV